LNAEGEAVSWMKYEYVMGNETVVQVHEKGHQQRFFLGGC